MTKRLLTAGLIVLLGASVANATDADVITAADNARGDANGVTFALDVTDKGDKVQLDVKARGGDFLGVYSAPADKAGQKLIQRGQNMWYTTPDASKPVPISPRQRLLGAASYGDIASQNWTSDYNAKKTGDDTVNGTAVGVYELTAKTPEAAYDKIKLYIDKSDLAVKADYESTEGKVMKTATFQYGNQVTRGGASDKFLSMMEIKQGADVTTLSYSKVKLAPVPADTFRVE